MMNRFLAAILPLVAATPLFAEAPVSFSGIYPHLAYWNREGECGTGAVVPWAGKLWVITYAPHKPSGSTDKLYEIDEALSKITRPESVGGTPANRMIHRESQQLFIGPYAIDSQRNVRVIAPMFGRLTGNARHLTDPAGKIYCATMEEGLYEIDVKTLAATELWADEQVKAGRHADLPGYHGKGLYSGQGRIVYANNGDHAKEALTNPAIPSGVLAEWDGKSPAWTVARRNQFTDVTGPGGIEGNPHPETDPIWSIGWDYRSLILSVLDKGKWHAYRLPKASHCYDGAHGWNTEWPRIRDIGEESLLMTMHGTFWKFPKNFSPAHSAGIAPRSTYLKVIGDFCRWNDRLVLGCDDSAQSEFLNKSKAKGALAGPTISNSNLWFIKPETLDHLGPVRGSGAVWMDEPIKAGAPSDPYLFDGYHYRSVLLAHEDAEPLTFTFELDRLGNDQWKKLRDLTVPPRDATFIEFDPQEQGAWIRVVANRDSAKTTALFFSHNQELGPKKPDAIFNGLAPSNATDYSSALLRSGGDSVPTLAVAASFISGGKVTGEALYHMGEDAKLRRINNVEIHERSKTMVALPLGVLQSDAASLLFIDEKGTRYRLPRGGPDYDSTLPMRVCREVCTERDLFHAGNIFYEVPAANAGGFAKLRPIAAHPFHITDYCSWRGLLILSGISPDAPAGEHIVRSDDNQCALWLGAVDDLWKLGRPSGHGGPWKETPIKAGEPSDAYLCGGFELTKITLSHNAKTKVTFKVEADFAGTGLWHRYTEFELTPGIEMRTQLPNGFPARWLRITSDTDCKATAQLQYE